MATVSSAASTGAGVTAAAGRAVELDGLRAVAIAGVLINHFLTPDAVTRHLGVRLFMVISGYLITRSLLSAQGAVVRGEAWPGQLARFYGRRALRIFPAYYLLLVLLYLTDAAGFRASAPWHALHLSNIWFALTGAWNPWVVAHLWSLSLQEQFYLIWPWVILFLPRGWLAATCVATIAVAIVLRAVTGMMPGADLDVALWVLPQGSADVLAVGALLAVLGLRRSPATNDASTRPVWLGSVLWPLSIVAALCWLAVQWNYRSAFAPATGHEAGLMAYVVQDSLTTFAFAGLVAAAVTGSLGPLGLVLRLGPIVALGRISYGVYLYHMPIYAVLIWLTPLFSQPGPFSLCVGGAITVLVAAASWRWLEAPMLRLLPGTGAATT